MAVEMSDRLSVVFVESKYRLDKNNGRIVLRARISRSMSGQRYRRHQHRYGSDALYLVCSRERALRNNFANLDLTIPYHSASLDIRPRQYGNMEIE